jgi:hypothetical protein
MALDFPSSPTNGQQYLLNGKMWQFNSTISAWALVDQNPFNAGLAFNQANLVFGQANNT